MSSTSTTTPPRRVRVGIVGCGEVTQVIHLPTLIFLSHLFHITVLCDVSPTALAHCSARLPHPHRTVSQAYEVWISKDVDVVFILSPDEFHAKFIVATLFTGNDVFVEKPMALTIRDADRIMDAERRSGRRVMVGYMRRYAAAWKDALEEIGGAGEVAYARVRGKPQKKNTGE